MSRLSRPTVYAHYAGNAYDHIKIVTDNVGERTEKKRKQLSAKVLDSRAHSVSE